LKNSLVMHGCALCRSTSPASIIAAATPVLSGRGTSIAAPEASGRHARRRDAVCSPGANAAIEAVARVRDGLQAGACDDRTDGVGATEGTHCSGLFQHRLAGGQSISGIGELAGPHGWALQHKALPTYANAPHHLVHYPRIGTKPVQPHMSQELGSAEDPVHTTHVVHGVHVHAAVRRSRSAVGRAPACVTACRGGRCLARWPEPGCAVCAPVMALLQQQTTE